MKVKTLAIPVRVVEFSESSQIVSLYTRECGLVEGIAKGSHREKSSFQGPFDLAVLYEIILIERRSGGLSILTESTVIDGLRGLRARLDRQMAATHVIDLLRLVATAAAPDPPLFDLSHDVLVELSSSEGEEVSAAMARFDARALRILGLLGALDSCVVCGRPWPGGTRAAYLSPRAGGLLCSRCRAARSYAGVALPGSAVLLLGRLAGAERPWPEIEAGWAAHGERLSRAISELRNHLLEKELKPMNVPPRPGI